METHNGGAAERGGLTLPSATFDEALESALIGGELGSVCQFLRRERMMGNEVCDWKVNFQGREYRLSFYRYEALRTWPWG